MVYGRSIDRLRSDGSRRRRERAEAADPDEGDGDTVHDEVWRGVVVGEVRAALRVLTPGEAEAILLAYFGGFSYQQVAVLLGQPEGTTKARIRSGLHRMRRQLVLSLTADERSTLDLRDGATQPQPRSQLGDTTLSRTSPM
jgi:RNA polymerase sigma-70 factor (ECF subfamily)